jgi:hypothetical protein
LKVDCVWNGGGHADDLPPFISFGVEQLGHHQLEQVASVRVAHHVHLHASRKSAGYKFARMLQV